MAKDLNRLLPIVRLLASLLILGFTMTTMTAAAERTMTTTHGPRVILGTMTIGGQTNQADATTMLLDFCGESNDNKWRNLVRYDQMVDTAIMYQNGNTETILGKIIRQHFPTKSSLSIATKANAFTKNKNLSPSGLRKQLESSLKELELPQGSVDIFYLHAPDANHAIEPTLEEVQKMYKEGKFRRFALSNFAAWEVVYIHSYMKSRQYVLPTIYQGMYNAITRQVESELFPALKKLNIAFYAYNPLAGGMLSGKYQWSKEIENSDDAAAKANAQVGGRFAGTTFWAKRYRERYQQMEQYQAVEIIRSALKDGESLAGASLRWMRHHSKLSDIDGIIVGASKLTHYHANMESLSAGPLSEEVVKAFNEANKLCQNVCPDYSRGYSGSSLEK